MSVAGIHCGRVIVLVSVNSSYLNYMTPKGYGNMPPN